VCLILLLRGPKLTQLDTHGDGGCELDLYPLMIINIRKAEDFWKHKQAEEKNF
jgi:hypothetical protein